MRNLDRDSGRPTTERETACFALQMGLAVLFGLATTLVIWLWQPERLEKERVLDLLRDLFSSTALGEELGRSYPCLPSTLQLPVNEPCRGLVGGQRLRPASANNDGSGEFSPGGH
jgi:hypothetical protein